MMLSLLADRFKLVLHREIREVAVYDLVIARRDGTLGPQLRRTNIADLHTDSSKPQCGAMRWRIREVRSNGRAGDGILAAGPGGLLMWPTVQRLTAPAS